MSTGLKFVKFVTYMLFACVLFSQCKKENLSPTASFVVYPQNGNDNTQFNFDASDSFDPEGKALAYYWDFNGDGTDEFTNQQSADRAYIFPYPSEFRVRLTVKDDKGYKHVYYKNVKVSSSNTPPLADFTISPSGGSVFDTFLFDASSSSDGQSSIDGLRFRWDWTGDGQFDSDFSNSTTMSRKFSTGGSKRITLEVMDPEGLTDTKLKEIVVIDMDPRVLRPNGGEKWRRGTYQTISWEDFPGDNVNIDLYKNSTRVQNIVGETNNDKSYSWRIPDHLLLNTSYRIKISSGSNSDYSDGYFEIFADPTVIYPNGGEILNRGNNVEIKWENFSGNYVKIEILRGTSVVNIINSSTPNDGSHHWIVPSDFPLMSDYRIRISEDGGSDTSDGDFEVRSNTPQVTDPNGGEYWLLGQSYDITWKDFSENSVKIELFKGGSLHSTISSSTPNDGSYNWRISQNHAQGTDFKIKGQF